MNELNSPAATFIFVGTYRRMNIGGEDSQEYTTACSVSMQNSGTGEQYVFPPKFTRDPDLSRVRLRGLLIALKQLKYSSAGANVIFCCNDPAICDVWHSGPLSRYSGRFLHPTAVYDPVLKMIDYGDLWRDILSNACRLKAKLTFLPRTDMLSRFVEQRERDAKDLVMSSRALNPLPPQHPSASLDGSTAEFIRQDLKEEAPVLQTAQQ